MLSRARFELASPSRPSCVSERHFESETSKHHVFVLREKSVKEEMDPLTDKELENLTLLQNLFPEEDLHDLLEIARSHLKSDDTFESFLNGFINQRNRNEGKVKTESDEEEERLMMNLKSSFESHLSFDPPPKGKIHKDKAKVNEDCFPCDRVNGNVGLVDNYVKENSEELLEIIYGSPSQIENIIEKKEKDDSDSDSASFHSFKDENEDNALDGELIDSLFDAKKPAEEIPPQIVAEEAAQEKSTFSEDTAKKGLVILENKPKETENDFSFFNSLIKSRKRENPNLETIEETKKQQGPKKVNEKKEIPKKVENDVGVIIDHFLKQNDYSKKRSAAEDPAKDYAEKGAKPKIIGKKNEAVEKKRSESRSQSNFDDETSRLSNQRPGKNLQENKKEENVFFSPKSSVVPGRGEEDVSIADSKDKKKEIPPQKKQELLVPDFPFIYVVPEYPCSKFRLPKGAYWVKQAVDVNKELETLKSHVPVVYHPEAEVKVEAPASIRSSKPDLNFPPPKPKESPGEKKTNYGLPSLPPPSCSTFRGSETIKINRSEVKAKIFCNTPLQSLKKDGEDQNDSTDAYGLILQSVANDFGSGKGKKNLEPDKKFGKFSESPKAKPCDRFSEEVANNVGYKSFKTKRLESGLVAEAGQEPGNVNPALLQLLEMLKKVKPEELEKKLENDFVQEEAQRNTHRASLEQTIFEEAYNKALKELPDTDPEFLYIKLQSLNGNEREIDSFIQEEKVKSQLRNIKNKLSNQFPNFDRDFLDKKSKDFLCDPDGLATFIQEEKRKLKIDEQYELMVNSLPNLDPLVLRQIAEDLEGNSELVREFIQDKKLELQKEEEKTTQIINMHLILPDADPEFLREKFEELSASGNPDALNAFFYNLLDSQDYPKIQKDDPAVRERNELWRRFVENFDVKDFLMKVPNPEETYTGDKGDNNKTELGLILKFLQSRYPDLDVTDLEKIFKDRKNNLTNTCAQLDFQHRPIEIMDVSFRSENISESFLLEIVFILRRREIRDYLREEKALRDLKLERARKEKALLQCRCCFDEELLETDVTTCPEGHIFCIDCIKRSVETQLADGVTKFRCLGENCETEFSLVTLEKVLEPSLYRKVLRKKQSAEVNEARVAGLESCPACDFAYIPSPLDKIFKCQNQDCLRETCRNCHEESHVPLRCEEVERPKDLKIRTEIEEKMTEALVRTCPKCGKKFVKTDGCNKMTCTCGAVMCYLCRKLVDNYSHFNGQGGDKFHLCPLWSTNEDLHVNRVKEVGVRARDEALRQNPDVHLVHDPTKTL